MNPVEPDDLVPPIGGARLRHIAGWLADDGYGSIVQELTTLAVWLDRYIARTREAIIAIETAKGEQ